MKKYFASFISLSIYLSTQHNFFFESSVGVKRMMQNGSQLESIYIETISLIRLISWSGWRSKAISKIQQSETKPSEIEHYIKRILRLRAAVQCQYEKKNSFLISFTNFVNNFFLLQSATIKRHWIIYDCEEDFLNMIKKMPQPNCLYTTRYCCKYLLVTHNYSLASFNTPNRFEM